MTKLNFEKLNKQKLVRKRNGESDCTNYSQIRATSAKKRRTRGRNVPRPAMQRYRWKEEIFGKGCPDLLALREGPYQPPRNRNRPKPARRHRNSDRDPRQ